MSDPTLLALIVGLRIGEKKKKKKHFRKYIDIQVDSRDPLGPNILLSRLRVKFFIPFFAIAKIHDKLLVLQKVSLAAFRY